MQFRRRRPQPTLAESKQAAPPDNLLHEEASQDVPPRQPGAPLLRLPRPHSEAQRVHVRLRVTTNGDQPAQEQQSHPHRAVFAGPEEQAVLVRGLQVRK